MDETITKWIMEYLIRKHQISSQHLNAAVTTTDRRLKKTILLRKIESKISNHSVSEKLLDAFESIQSLDDEPSDLMKEAYCAVAVDCTARYLEEDNNKYAMKVSELWRKRVLINEGLVSDSAKRWFEDIESAVEEGGVRERILRMDTRKEAVKAVKAYLKEAWEGLGPTFLETVAGNAAGNAGDAGDGGGGERCSRDPFGSFAFGGIQNGQAPLRRKHIAVKGRRQRGAKITDVYEETVNGVSTPETDKVQDATAEADIVEDENRFGSMEMGRGENCLSDDQEPLMAVPLAFRVHKKQRMVKKTKANMRGNSEAPEPAGPTIWAPQESTPTDEDNTNKQVNVMYNLRGRATPDSEKRSLLDPNDNSHAHELVDSFENRTASPSVRAISHGLVKPRVCMTSASEIPEVRRKRKRWSPLEEDALRTGVQIFGKGYWNAILQHYRDIFVDRTYVDLKDKWRNMTGS